MDVPFHADLLLLAQCRGRLLLQAHSAEPQTGRLSMVDDLESAITRYIAATNRRPNWTVSTIWLSKPMVRVQIFNRSIEENQIEELSGVPRRRDRRAPAPSGTFSRTDRRTDPAKPRMR